MAVLPKWLSVRVKSENAAEIISLIPSEYIEGTLEISSSEADLFFRADKIESVLSWLSSHGLAAGEHKEIENENWTANCHWILERLRVGSLTIVPFEAPSDISLSKDEIGIIAGLGFGTGHHESTKIALSLLQSEEVIKSRPKRVLDVGTGSGILAIASEKLFSASIVAVDNDPLALINANDNLKLNSSSSIDLALSTASSIVGEFDLITANIYAEVLTELSETFHELLSESNPAFLILSGVENIKRKLVDNSVSECSAYSPSKWKHIASMSEGNWCGLLYWKELSR